MHNIHCLISQMNPQDSVIKICIIDPLQVRGGQEKVVFDIVKGNIKMRKQDLSKKTYCSKN